MADDKKIDAAKILLESQAAATSAEVQRLNRTVGKDESDPRIKEAISNFGRYGSMGAIDSAIGDNFFGINHRQTPGVIPINKDVYGLTFFTRPRMNMAAANLRNLRKLTPLLTKDVNSIQRIIRNTLDNELDMTGVSCPFVDPQQPFIPMLTNDLISISGWPDMVAPTYTSPDGYYKENFSYVDGTVKQYSAYQLSANFRNTPGDPITTLFMNWLVYMGAVYEGVLVPKMDMLIEHEIDYMTRIYRLVLDPTKMKVQKIGACGAAFPISAPTGAAFNFESNTPLNQSNAQISISFQALGFEAMEHLLVYEFNRVGIEFNSAMADGKRQQMLQKVPPEYLQLFNNRGYARIDPDTYELEWWVSKDFYRQRLAGAI